MKTHLLIPVLLAAWLLASAVHGATTTAEVKNLSFNGGLEDGKARLVIEAVLKGLEGDPEKAIFATALQQSVKVERDKIAYTVGATLDLLRGEPKELPLTLGGEGEIRQVTGEALQDWSIRWETNGTRTLVLRPRRTDKPLTRLSVTILAERELKSWSDPAPILTFAPPHAALLDGYIKVESIPELNVQPEKPAGLVPLELQYLPEPMRRAVKPDEVEPLAFRVHGAAYALPLRITAADPELRRVVLRNFKLTGQLNDQTASFTLTATARVRNPEGGSLNLLSGDVALTRQEPRSEGRLRFENGQFVITFDRPGEFPVTLQFNASVRQADGWNAVDFHVAPSALQPIALQGLAADTQFEFANAARPERTGSEFASYLPADGAVKLSWKEARKAEEGKLFYAAELLSQISISPGLMSQVALVNGKVMQGELNRVGLVLRGAGEVTRIQGDQVLAWNVEPMADSSDRRLVVQFNQPQKDQFMFQVQMQTPLGAFPQAVDAMQLRPDGATRFAGYFRIVNDGAVRLEVVQAAGLSQISPEQFPETDATKAAFRATGNQRFAYRFSGAEFALRIQADQILPELTVSEVLAYRLGESELTIDSEIELDIREAPLRELLLRVPKGYAIARLNASGLSDYFLRDLEDGTDAELRLVFGQPVAGRQVIQLRLERNQALGETSWALPRIEVSKAKAVRGHVGISADAGFRLTAERTQALTEIATAFFPRKVANIQAAFRLSEPAWQATMRVERLPQTVQADGFHLFSIGEGVAYGSSVINYVVSGAPVSVFRVELSDEYFNVEFTGKDIRNWQKTTNGFVVALHTPVAGAYTLLATYERPFKSQGETLAFTGARPLDAQSEQGHTLVVSAYQFQVKAVDVSPGLLPLETGEVPSEYRLFFDAPILAAYRYTARPFNLQLALSPLAQGDTLSQVVDRASLTTRISKEGQVLTDARYFIKNRGNPHFRMTLPEGTELWSATVNGAAVVPVTDAKANLIPLPQRADANAVLTLDLKLAARSKSPARVTVAAPIVNAPVMLAEWKLEPDTGQRLAFRKGSLTPVAGVADISGFAQLARVFSGRGSGQAWLSVLAIVVMVAASVIVWGWAAREGRYRFSLAHLVGLGLGIAAFVLAAAAMLSLAHSADRQTGFLPRSVTFLAPVQEASSALTAEVANVGDKVSGFAWAGHAWPVVLALVVWAYGWLKEERETKIAAWLLGWTLVAWAALRCPNGVPIFLLVLGAFLILHVVIPSFRRLWQLPAKPTPPAGSGPAPAVAALLMAGLLWPGLGSAATGRSADMQSAVSQISNLPAGASSSMVRRVQLGDTADYKSALLRREPPLAESVVQQIRVDEKFALATAKVRWQAVKGQLLPVLYEPAVLTRITFPTNTLKLVQQSIGATRAWQLLALENGGCDIELSYQVAVGTADNETGFKVGTQYGLVNRATATVLNKDVDITPRHAVSVERQLAGSNTVAEIVFAPSNEAWVGWKPRSRDVKREKPVFYAEWTQLYVPTAGVIEAVHQAAIRPAQGELAELVFNVPQVATVTDVTDAATNPKSGVSLWRFDPDTRKLRVTLNPPQSKPFALIIRSQVATGPLPFDHAVGLVSVDNAAGQIGLVGMATGNEVQLDSVTAEALSPINLEDFPGSVAQLLQAQIPGLTVRRAFRYSDPRVSAAMKASPVEADVRVESQDTLSLGEDRIVLAANVTVNISRAGIFRLSFVLPANLDVESISGAAMSHWTELKTDAGRVITLHLKGKTEGQQQFAVSLSGPGVKSATSWATPQIVFREAGKQQGTLMIVPEQGMRLQVSAREGVTQLDPQKSGIRQKGVLVFRILQSPWNLALDLEQVDPWIQVTSLQHANVGEAQVKIAANLQYQIENTGLKAFRVLLPANAESVRFQGDQVADFLPTPGAITNGMQEWEVKLHRRVIGKYLLQVNYQTLTPAQATEVVLRGVQAVDVNLQRGFVTVQSGGRLQLRVDNQPAALQPTEWQSIPRTLQQDLASASASFAYRLVEPAFQLPLKLERHEAAKLLPARVNNITFTSVISDDGVMLTQARLEMLSGDKRLLRLTLPKNAEFWFAFVNQSGVWPWREQDQILIPLEQQSRTGQALPVELFFSSRIGKGGGGSLDLNLLAPKFDLPLENITWRVFLSEKWRVKDWTGTLQLQDEQTVTRAAAIDVQTYLQNEAAVQREQTKEAEQMLQLGNTFLEKGAPQQARRAFQAAYGLSQGDQAFNEDARVQLNNLKLQQALVGLNVRQAAVAGETDAVAGKLRDLRGRKEATYTQQDAKEIIDRNTAEDNTAFMRLAERLIQQQDAAVSSPAAIRAAIPEQGRLLTFKRAVVVDQWADLRIGLEASAARTASLGMRVLILMGTVLVLGVFGWLGRRFLRVQPTSH